MLMIRKLICSLDFEFRLYVTLTFAVERQAYRRENSQME